MCVCMCFCLSVCLCVLFVSRTATKELWTEYRLSLFILINNYLSLIRVDKRVCSLRPIFWPGDEQHSTSLHSRLTPGSDVRGEFRILTGIYTVEGRLYAPHGPCHCSLPLIISHQRHISYSAYYRTGSATNREIFHEVIQKEVQWGLFPGLQYKWVLIFYNIGNFGLTPTLPSI